jgi:hypothetical protein
MVRLLTRHIKRIYYQEYGRTGNACYKDVSNPLKWNLGNNVEITWQDQTGKKIIRSVTLPTPEGKGGILGVV